MASHLCSFLGEELVKLEVYLLAGGFTDLTGLWNPDKPVTSFDLMSPSWFFPLASSLFCAWSHNRTFLNSDLYFCWNCLERIWQLQCTGTKMRGSQLCWQVAGAGLMLSAQDLHAEPVVTLASRPSPRKAAV